MSSMSSWRKSKTRELKAKKCTRVSCWCLTRSANSSNRNQAGEQTRCKGCGGWLAVPGPKHDFLNLPRHGVELELGAPLPVPHRVLPRAGDPRGRAALRRKREMLGELRLLRALTDEQIAAMRDPRFV